MVGESAHLAGCQGLCYGALSNCVFIQAAGCPAGRWGLGREGKGSDFLDGGDIQKIPNSAKRQDGRPGMAQ